MYTANYMDDQLMNTFRETLFTNSDNDDEMFYV